MFANLIRLLQGGCSKLQHHPSRSICGTQPCLKLDTCSMYDKLKFEFTEENQVRAKDLLNSYPEAERRAALLPLLDLAQRQYGWLPISAITTVAGMLKIEPFAAWEVASFYTMFRLHPMGKFRVKVCTTTPCFLRGSDEILKTCENILELKDGETSKDMQFTLQSIYCLGACVNAPVMTVNDDIFEDLSTADIEEILCNLKQDIIPPSGPRSSRFASEPDCGPTTLLIEPPPAGYCMQDICKKKNKSKKPC